ncbi:MAG: PPOX class F420-dependent oxidoreductase [Actinobacteria bacterium]|nr:PPOX class F420-dependent oxidoreductase [Actinomycetota bacterium]
MPADVIPSSHRDLLDKAGFAHVASLGPDGNPQSHPVWYDFQDGQLCFSTTKSRQKFRNVSRHPRVAVSILDPDNPYRYLEIRGEVAAIEDDPHKKFIDFLAGKYLGEDEYPNKQPDAERVIIRIEPEHAATMG